MLLRSASTVRPPACEITSDSVGATSVIGTVLGVFTSPDTTTRWLRNLNTATSTCGVFSTRLQPLIDRLLNILDGATCSLYLADVWEEKFAVRIDHATDQFVGGAAGVGQLGVLEHGDAQLVLGPDQIDLLVR